MGQRGRRQDVYTIRDDDDDDDIYLGYYGSIIQLDSVE
jgi:hypothetical protein